VKTACEYRCTKCGATVRADYAVRLFCVACQKYMQRWK
jgi:hypothetical protein